MLINQFCILIEITHLKNAFLYSYENNQYLLLKFVFVPKKVINLSSQNSVIKIKFELV